MTDDNLPRTLCLGLDGAGMHWTEYGSNAILALRGRRLSGPFQDFWERRSQRRAA
jgi:hypothetical protein